MTIQRKTPLRRSTLDKKTAKPRLRRWACSHCSMKNDPAKKKCLGCGIGRKTKRRSLSTRCDSMWAQIVKAGGVCAMMLVYTRPNGRLHYYTGGGECSGPLEAAHIVPRRFRSVRWDTANGRPLCHAHHRYFTDHEKAWRDFIGPEWDRLWVKAQERWDKTFPVASLSAQLEQVKEALRWPK